MKQILLLFLFHIFFTVDAQNQEIHSVYFDIGKKDISSKTKNDLLSFIKNVDSTKVESVAILGYCDDRGSAEFNQKLSNDRASQIKNILSKAGVKHKIIVNIQGKGKVEINDSLSSDEIEKIRKQNRRVDLIISFKDPLKKIPGVNYYITDKTKRGDRIYLKSVDFPLDRSILTPKALKELKIIALQLKKYKNLQIEIQGHVCCTIGSPEAYDEDTGKKELSTNRAKAVYNFLIKNNIDPKRLTYKGYGSHKPLGLEPELDKRVEFLITRS